MNIKVRVGVWVTPSLQQTGSVLYPQLGEPLISVSSVVKSFSGTQNASLLSVFQIMKHFDSFSFAENFNSASAHA